MTHIYYNSFVYSDLFVCDHPWVCVCVCVPGFCFICNLWFSQGRVSDPNSYYSCDDNFILVEKTVLSNLGARHADDESHKANDLRNIPCAVTSNLEGICLCFLTAITSSPFLLHISNPVKVLAHLVRCEDWYKLTFRVTLACIDSNSYICWVYFVFAIYGTRILNSCLLSGGPVIHWFDIIKGKVGKRNILCVARMLISFMVKLVAFFCSLPLEFWRRQNNIYPSRRQDNIYPSKLIVRNFDSHSTPVEAGGEEDHVRPCIERLQRLEKIFEELSNKPAGIPLEKEQMLLESLERIKSVELDLEKTKKVCLFLLGVESLDAWKLSILL